MPVLVILLPGGGGGEGNLIRGSERDNHLLWHIGAVPRARLALGGEVAPIVANPPEGTDYQPAW
jgi:hypothetical protein